MERRRSPKRASEKATALPPDYMALVSNVFATNFASELERLTTPGERPAFRTGGGLFPNEVVLWVALAQPGRMGATTVHASCDFEVGDETPQDAEARLAACVDAIGLVFSELLAPEAMPRLRIGSQATLEQMPMGWSETKIRDRAVYLMVDSSNPDLEKMTEDWLAKNDPDPIIDDIEEVEADEAEAEVDEAPQVGGKKLPPTKH